jgi:hypothetical protein
MHATNVTRQSEGQEMSKVKGNKGLEKETMAYQAFASISSTLHQSK